MRYSYDRTARASGPISEVLVDRDWWNKLHDLENALEAAAFEYDKAGSYNGGDGEKEAKAVMKQIEEAIEKIKNLSYGDNSVFGDLIEAEGSFVKKHGTIEQYVRAQQDRMGFR